MGGGNTTNNVIEYEKKLKQHFVFSVADSDFHFQGDSHLGETAKKFKIVWLIILSIAVFM